MDGINPGMVVVVVVVVLNTAVSFIGLLRVTDVLASVPE
jgi:hypothetical protein